MICWGLDQGVRRFKTGFTGIVYASQRIGGILIPRICDIAGQRFDNIESIDAALSAARLFFAALCRLGRRVSGRTQSHWRLARLG